MIAGQILVYRFNGLWNSKPNVDRNLFTVRDVDNVAVFRSMIEEALDEVPPGKGYVLARWSGKTFICEKDVNKPEIGYIRHEVLYHPLLSKFTV
jgi:hypothetical protein